MSSNEQKGSFDEGPFQRLFGPNATIKVLDFLTTHEDFDYSINEIAEYTGVHRRTVSRVIPTLEYYLVVKKNRKIDRANMYKIDKEIKISSMLRKLAYGIATHDAEITVEQEMSKLSETEEKTRILAVPD